MIRLLSSTRGVAAILFAVLLSFGCATPAFGDQLADKKTQAAAVEAQIAALDTKAEVATEQYDTANVRLGQVTVQAQATERRIVQLKARTKKLQTALDGRAAEMYRNPLGFLDVLLGARSFDDFNTALAVLTNISSQDANTVGRLKQAKGQAVAARATLLTAQAEAARQRAATVAAASQVRSQLAARQQVLTGLNADVKNLIAQQQAAEAAAGQARYLALAARQRAVASRPALAGPPAGTPKRAKARGGGASAPRHGGGTSPVPSSGSRGARAVAWAEKALGCPYRSAGAGPNSFDCSGLTMWAYGHVGVSLPHSSAEQIGCGRRVSRAALQPGDLVFFGSPIHHVGMYVGGGDFIEAPHTGAVVRIAALADRSDYAGACRP